MNNNTQNGKYGGKRSNKRQNGQLDLPFPICSVQEQTLPSSKLQMLLFLISSPFRLLFRQKTSHRIKGYFVDGQFWVQKREDIDSLWHRGFFGKGNLSRGGAVWKGSIGGGE